MAKINSIYICYDNKFLRIKKDLIEWKEKPWEATKFKSSTYKNHIKKMADEGKIGLDIYKKIKGMRAEEAYRICFSLNPEYEKEKKELDERKNTYYKYQINLYVSLEEFDKIFSYLEKLKITYDFIRKG